jgi:hypothetical protein
MVYVGDLLCSITFPTISRSEYVNVVAGVPGDAEMLFKALKAYSIVARKA